MDILDTKKIPHMKFRIPLPWNPKCPKQVTYYIGCIKEDGIRGYGKFQIHEKIDGNNEGYGGSTLGFLMDDGSTELVKGPFFKYPTQHTRILFEILMALKGEPEL